MSDSLNFLLAKKTTWYATVENNLSYLLERSSQILDQKNALVEIPEEQYATILEEIQNKNLAIDRECLSQGGISFAQAKNLACAGKISALIFDPEANSVTTYSLLGISGSVAYALAIWNGFNEEEALNLAMTMVLQHNLAIDDATDLHLASLERKGAKKNTVGKGVGLFLKNAAKGFTKSQEGKKIIVSVVKTSIGKTGIGQRILGTLTKNQLTTSATNMGQLSTRLIRSNVLLSLLAMIVVALPDFYRATFAKSISWRQFGKNFAVNGFGVIGGASGWYGGCDLGYQIAYLIPALAEHTVSLSVGVFGAVVGGLLGAQFVKMLLDRFWEDDAEIIMRMLREEAEAITSADLLGEHELEQIDHYLAKTLTKKKWLLKIYASGCDQQSRCLFAHNLITEYCQQIVNARIVIDFPDNATILEKFKQFLQARLTKQKSENLEVD